MTIDELNALTTLTEADEVPVWDSEESGEPTKKITASNLSASVKSLGSLIGTGDLDSTPTSGSNKAVTSGGVYTAIQQSTASTKIGTVTIATGTSNISVRQYGNVVYIGGWVSNATITANAEVKIADISGVSLPPDSVRAFCSVGANAYSAGTMSYITLGTSGGLYVNSSNGGTGKAIYFDICYVANN